MKKIILFLSVIIYSCSNDDPDSAPAPQNIQSFSQDSRLIGGWRLDSTLEDTVMKYGYPGDDPMMDSISFSVFNSNINPPVSDFNSYFVVSQDSCIKLPSCYFWETTSQDSLLIRCGNHSQDVVHRLKYYLNGNNITFKWNTPVSLQQRSVESYYHR